MIKPIKIHLYTNSFKELIMEGVKGRITIWMSYEEIIGFSYLNETFKVKKGVFSVTTSRHCGRIPGTEKDLVEFRNLLQKALNDFRIYV